MLLDQTKQKKNVLATKDLQLVQKQITPCDVEDNNPSCSTLLAKTQNFLKENKSFAASQLLVKVLSNSHCSDSHSNCVQNAVDNLGKIFCKTKKNKGSHFLIKSVCVN